MMNGSVMSEVVSFSNVIIYFDDLITKKSSKGKSMGRFIPPKVQEYLKRRKAEIFLRV